MNEATNALSDALPDQDDGGMGQGSKVHMINLADNTSYIQ